MTDMGKMLAKFYKNIEKKQVRDHLSPCWLWTGFLNRDGYGVIQFGKKRVAVHRWSYEFIGEKGPLGKMLARHKCDNPTCCNPSHLEPGTHKQNSQDIIDRGRHHNKNKTHCPYGHLLEGSNLKLNATTGYRECVTCSKNRYKSHKCIPSPIKFKIVDLK